MVKTNFGHTFGGGVGGGGEFRGETIWGFAKTERSACNMGKQGPLWHTYFNFWPYKYLCRIFKMIGCSPEVLTLLLTPISTYVCMSNARRHSCQKCHICHLWHIWQVWCSDIHHMYGCQYGCQKKRKDLRNAANHLIYPTKIFVGSKIGISYFLIFPLYFLEFPK